MNTKFSLEEKVVIGNSFVNDLAKSYKRDGIIKSIYNTQSIPSYSVEVDLDGEKRNVSYWEYELNKLTFESIKVSASSSSSPISFQNKEKK